MRPEHVEHRRIAATMISSLALLSVTAIYAFASHENEPADREVTAECTGTQNYTLKAGDGWGNIKMNITNMDPYPLANREISPLENSIKANEDQAFHEEVEHIIAKMNKQDPNGFVLKYGERIVIPEECNKTYGN